MDVRRIFRTVSNKLLEDFAASGEIAHLGLRGGFRESALFDFLKDGRLPGRFGLGSGEIIGPARNVSRQSDLVIFDALNGLSLMLSASAQVFPIESVCGTVEVKSKLSKTELVIALENIKSVKQLTPRENVVDRKVFITTTYVRPRPFGMIFAYGLADNSLQSLLENLRDWEADNPPEDWPNYIAVLNEGVITHHGTGFGEKIFNDDLKVGACPYIKSAGNDTLFQFYLALLDLAGNTHVGPAQLRRYYEPAEQVGPFVVRNHDKLRSAMNPDDKRVYRFNLDFIKKIVAWAKANGATTHRDFFRQQLGTIPIGVDEAYLNHRVYLYNPDNLPGLNELSAGPEHRSNPLPSLERSLVSSHWIEVDGETYYFPMAYVTDQDTELTERIHEHL